MWTIGYDDSDGDRVNVGWFIVRDMAVAALKGFNWHYTVEYCEEATFGAS